MENSFLEFCYYRVFKQNFHIVVISREIQRESESSSDLRSSNFIGTGTVARQRKINAPNCRVLNMWTL